MKTDSLELSRFQTARRASRFSRFAAEFEEIRPLFRVSAFDVLWDAYTEEGRHYHTHEHLLLLLRLFSRFRELVIDPPSLKAALFFHDAVYHIPYDPQFPPARDNEERSVKLMQLLALYPQSPVIQKAAQLIRATASHAYTADTDSRLLHDIDLSIFASSRQRYLRYEQQVRAEYAVYPLALYCTARLGILRSYLERRHIYALGPMRALWEERARANLAFAVAALSKGEIPA